MSSSQTNRGVNDLPIEILQWIFELGAAEDIDERALRLKRFRAGMARAEAEDTDTGFPRILYDSDDIEDSEVGSESGEMPKEPIRPLFAVAVSQVCRYWRQAALSNHVMWDWIRFSMHEPEFMPETCLARSGDCPLDICLDYGIPNKSLFDNLTVENDDRAGMMRDIENESIAIMKTITPLVHRLRCLQVYLGTQHQMEELMKHLDGGSGAPLLKYLYLEGRSFADDHTLYRAGSLFGGRLPQLVVLKLWEVNFDLSFILPRTNGPTTSPASQFSNLGQMDLCGFEVEHSTFKNVLAHCPKLERIFLQDFKLLSPSPTSGIRPVLQGLKQLHADDSRFPSNAFPLFASLYAPNLTELEFVSEPDFDNENAIHELSHPQPPGKLFSVPSFSHSNESMESATAICNVANPYQLVTSLERLELGFIRCREDVAITLLQNCRNLKALNLEDYTETEAFFTILSRHTMTLAEWETGPSVTDRRQQLLFPKLCHLTIKSTADTLMEFLKARNDLGARIKKLTLYGYRHIPKLWITIMKQFVDELDFDTGFDDPDDAYEGDFDEEWSTTDDDDDEEEEEGEEGSDVGDVVAI